MTLSKPVKYLVGIATVWVTLYPLLFVAIWFTTFFGIMASSSSHSNNVPPFFILPFFAIFPIHCLTIFISYGLDAFYLVHVIRNKVAPEAVRIILGLGTFFMGFIAMPVYYYLYIWRDQPPAWASVVPLPGPNEPWTAHS